jgi:hypothetical protein
MVTEAFCITIFDFFAEGRLTGNPDGVIKLLVSIKKINNRNTISVIDDMLNDESILCFDSNAILIWVPATAQ